MDSALRGKRVLVLRPVEQAGPLVALLEAAGAEPIAIPAIEISPSEDTAALDDVIARSHAFDWMVFTSVNGVRITLDRVQATGVRFDPRSVAAIGPATAAALEFAGITVTWSPSAYTTEALAAEFPAPPSSVCLIRAQSAGNELDETLQRGGYTVTRVDAYSTRAINVGAIREQMQIGIDVVMLTSASIAHAFADAASTLAGGVVVCCIGPATAAAARGSGMRVDVEALEHTIEGLVDALTMSANVES